MDIIKLLYELSVNNHIFLCACIKIMYMAIYIYGIE